MINLALIESKERALLFREASRVSEIAEAIIEKDFWVCFMLEHLFTKSIFKEHIFFKGGTSLSKCYGAIERFSEDIDIIMDWKILGYQENEPWQERSNTAQEHYNQEMNRKTSVFLKESFIPSITNDLINLKLKGFKLEMDASDDLAILFTYPAVYKDSYVFPSVKLEIGTLAARLPLEEKIITPFIEDYLKGEINGYGFKVKVVSAVRTFFEKITILHSEANRLINHPLRYARHYYDTYMLSNSKIYVEILKQIELLNEVVAFKNKFYRSPRSKYDEILQGKLKLVPNDKAINIFKGDYIKMSQMFFGKIPSFDEIIDRLKNVEEILNQEIKMQNHN